MVICVHIDIREDDLWNEVHTWTAQAPHPDGWYAEKKVLDVGDIAFTDASGAPLVVLERKKAEDLGASQKDGRYREQRARLFALRGQNVAIAYLIEAPPWSPTLTRTWCRGEFTEVHLQQSIVRLQLHHTIPVFMVTTTKESVHWIKRIAKALHVDPTCYQCGMATTQHEAAAVYTQTIHVKKADNNTPERIFLSMIQSIPGLGKASAEAIATHTQNSFRRLLELTEEQIGDIPAGKKRVGKKVGASVFQALHS
jgi:ERCC4-type nuclease